LLISKELVKQDFEMTTEAYTCVSAAEASLQTCLTQWGH